MKQALELVGVYMKQMTCARIQWTTEIARTSVIREKGKLHFDVHEITQISTCSSSHEAAVSSHLAITPIIHTRYLERRQSL